MQLNNNVSFKAVPGGQIKSLLAKNPEKLNEITQKLAPMGDKNSVVDIFYTSVRTFLISCPMLLLIFILRRRSDYLTKYSEPVTTLLLWKKKHHSLLKIYCRS